MQDLQIPLKFSDRFIPRRDSTDFDLSHHFINHSTEPKVLNEYSFRTISEDTFLNTTKHTYNTLNYCNILKKLLLKNQSRILNFAAPKHIPIDNAHVKDIPVSHLWPVVARQRPLLCPPSLVVDMPNINRLLAGQIVDWGSKGHIATTYEGEVHLWHPEKVLSKSITETNGKVRECVKWNKYGTHFAMALSHGIINVFDFELHKITAKAVCKCGLNCVVSSMQWMKNNCLITGCSRGRLCYWSPELKLISTYPEAHIGQIINIRISCREKYLVTTGNDCKVKTWFLSDLAEDFEMWFSQPVIAVDWHPWKEGLLAVGGPICMTIWNVNNRKPLDYQDHPHPNSCVDALTFNPNSAELLVSYYSISDECGVNYLTVLKNLKNIVDEVQFTSDRILYLLWDCTGTKVATAGSDENLCIWHFFGESSPEEKKYLRREKKHLATNMFQTLGMFGHCIR